MDIAISTTNSGLTTSGLLTSRTTSPVASSQKTAETKTSLGSNLTTAFRVSSSAILIEGSVPNHKSLFQTFR